MKNYFFGLVVILLIFGGFVTTRGDVPDADLDGVSDDVDACLNSDLTGDLEGTVVIDECDSGVQNVLIKVGCTISDLIMTCADGVENYDDFVSCVSHFTNALKPHVLSDAETGAIQSCAAQSSIGGLPCESNCDENSFRAALIPTLVLELTPRPVIRVRRAIPIGQAMGSVPPVCPDLKQ